jgi:hypothetical protein
MSVSDTASASRQQLSKEPTRSWIASSTSQVFRVGVHQPPSLFLVLNAKDYKIDGFRFDILYLNLQECALSSGAMRRFDQRTQTVKEERLAYDYCKLLVRKWLERYPHFNIACLKGR